MAKSKKHEPIRTSDEFAMGRLLRSIRPPSVPSAAFSWDIPAIMYARNEQLDGRFQRPVQLATNMRTDPALFTAWKNRLAPQRALAVELVKGRGARAGSVASEAEPLFGQGGAAVTVDTMADVNDALANHGFAVGYNSWQARDDGSRIDLVHRAWPLDYVQWYEQSGELRTTVEIVDAQGNVIERRIEPIVHGDGRWTIYSNHQAHPWRKDAAILSAGMVWAAHAFAGRDWCKGSASHGNAKVVGELPEGTALQVKDESGNLVISPHAEYFLELLEDVASLDTPVGVKPAGSKMDYLINSSRAWEVWRELGINAEKAAARLYLGTDGTLGAAGGAPGVDISQLFGVATTIVQGDLGAMERGVSTGVIEPWAAVNHGDSKAAPTRRYRMPDPDLARERDELAKRETTFTTAITARRQAGLEVTQSWVDQLADKLGVEKGTLAASQSTGFQLAPTDIAKAISLDEARGSLGMPPKDDPEEGGRPLAEVGMATSGNPPQEQALSLDRGAPLIELDRPDRFRIFVEGDRQQEPATLDALRDVPGQLLVTPEGGNSEAV